MTDTRPSAVEREADPSIETVTFDWLGHDIVLPASADDWDINVTRAFTRGDVVTAIELLVGPKQFAEIERTHRKAHGGKMLNRDLRPLGDKIAELAGFDSLGKS